MSNLTQFFGIQSTGGTVASSVTGKAAEALTAGDGLRLNENGEFIKTSKNGFRQGAHTQAYNADLSGVSGNELKLDVPSNYGRYTPQNERGSGFIASDGTYIQMFYSQQSTTNSQSFGFRSFNMTTYDQSSLWFKDWGSGINQSNFYTDHGAEYREFYSDSNYIHIAVTVFWKDSNHYVRNRPLALRLTKSNGTLAVYSNTNNDQSQSSAYSNAHINGSGSPGILANGVLVRSFQLGASQYVDRTGGVRLNSIVYDYNAPPGTFTAAANYSGTVADYNDAVHSLHLHDHDTRTFLTFEAPVALNNSKVVKKHVMAANGAITTTTVDSAFVLSNWAEATFNRYSQIYQISSSIYAAVYPESTTTVSIQKFTYDGGTTLTQSGSKIVLTLPSDVTVAGAPNDVNYYYTSRLADNDPKQLYMQHSNNGTTSQPTYNIISINLVAGTLNFARRTYGLTSGRTNRHGNIALGANKALILQNTTYQNFAYQRYELAFFTSELRTKDVVAVALANATLGQTDATAALYSGVTSTATLPSTHYVTKNGQSYLLDIVNSELPSERLNKAPSKLKWIGRRTDNPLLSAYQINGGGSYDWYNNVSYNQNSSFNIRNQVPSGGTGTTILKVSGAGMFKSDMYFGHRYNASGSIISRFGLYIDDILIWDSGSNTTTHYGYNYYNVIPNLTDVVFTTGFELKVLYANQASYPWVGAVQTVEMT